MISFTRFLQQTVMQLAPICGDKDWTEHNPDDAKVVFFFYFTRAGLTRSCGASTCRVFQQVLVGVGILSILL